MKKISIIIMALVVALVSCKKTPEVNLKYVDVERDLVTVGTTTANIQCDYDYIATLKKAYLYYGEGENEDDFTSVEMRVVQNTLYVELTGLRESTTYNYFYEFHNGFNSMRTALKSFKTEASPGGVTLPTVVTAAVTEITTNSAKGGGEVTDDGGAEVTERGICWSTNANPTLNNNHIAAGSGIGAFAAAMSDLEANTTYHVRAYAINEKGTAYGLDREFVTIGGGGSGAPIGAIDGLFSVSPTQKVYFSQGNLQYQASTNTWRFAEHQWDFVGSEVVYQGDPGGNVTGSSNHLISEVYDGWIDLFGWGTSGYNHGAVCYQPWSTSSNRSDYYAYGSPSCNLYDNTGQADWGYNPIINGGNHENIWRTLKQEEMSYVFSNRGVEVSFVRAVVNGVKGIILLPDDWDVSNYQFVRPNTVNNPYNDNVITSSAWFGVLEPKGAVFFPAAGLRRGLGVALVNSWGQYALSSAYDENQVYRFGFDEEIVVPNDVGSSWRDICWSVRLAHDAPPQPSIQTPTVITFDVFSITSNAASCSGEVTSDGGAEVTERGICWSTNTNPTISNSHVSAGAGMGTFSATISGLSANTTYHVRAYATNEAGTAYGEDKEFTTLEGGGSGNVPEGAINGLFTINENGDQVYFSQGNLQYRASTNTWRFAEKQWDFVGDGTYGTVYENGVKCNNELISSTYDGWIDLFGWGTSGWDNGNLYYHPYDSHYDSDFNQGYGPVDGSDLTGAYTNADWGIYNPISNGGNVDNQWRTLTYYEWWTVFNGRITDSGLRYAKAIVNDVFGVILLPDNWRESYYHINNPNVDDSFCYNNIISQDDWRELLEAKGAVFFPSAGLRGGESGELFIYFVNSNGYYWSSTNRQGPGSCALYFSDTWLLPENYGNYSCNGFSVRLIHDANPQNKSK